MVTKKEVFKIIAKTSFGLEDVLAEELQQLGVTDMEKVTRAVIFEGNKELLYRANIWLRTANRLIVPIHQFNIRNANDLYDAVKGMAWETFFDVDQTFAIDSTVFSKIFNHTKYAAFKAKDAIVDRFRDKVNDRPNIDIENPDIRINLHINDRNACTVSLDSSGHPLFKRGYREASGNAPIKEDLAAGMILLSGWDKKSDFVDLFCGSGTILMEAAMIAHNIAPNGDRNNFGFFNWKNFDAHLFDHIVEAAAASTVAFPHKIMGVDTDSRILQKAKRNVETAGLRGKIEVLRKDFRDFTPPSTKGIIISNPPYGVRLGEDKAIDALYTAFGDTLKAHYSGWNAWIISSNMGALKKVGLRPSRKIKLYNGSLECRMMKYEMYPGTKKIHKLKPQ